MTEEEAATVNEALSVWRQGDYVLTEDFPFLRVATLDLPGSDAAAELAAAHAAEELDLGTAAVAEYELGFFVVSQTCDIVGQCQQKEFAEVCPLIPVPAKSVGHVKAGHMTRYLYCGCIDGVEIAADLDRVTTVEKAFLASFTEQRESSAAGDDDARKIARVLAAKRGRAALPTDFVEIIRPIQERVKSKHGKASAEGQFLEQASEIRFLAEPHWGHDRVHVTMLVLFEDEDAIPSNAQALSNQLAERATASDKYSIETLVRSYTHLSAAAYRSSNALELDHLSDG